MRHDTHFVEAITAGRPPGLGQMMDIDQVEPNRLQPRKEFGRLEELVTSIKEKGILEPILVRAKGGDRYEIIAGERRYQAALRAGLSQIPVLEIDVDNRGALEVSLVENLQRKDLTPFEEAAAIQRLCADFDYTHDEVARKLGRSRIAITELLGLNRMPAEVQEGCRRADIAGKTTLLEIVRQKDRATMLAMVDRIRKANLTRDEVREARRAAGGTKTRTKHFVFSYRPPDRPYALSLRFKDRRRVERTELIDILRGILSELERDTPRA